MTSTNVLHLDTEIQSDKKKKKKLNIQCDLFHIMCQASCVQTQMESVYIPCGPCNFTKQQIQQISIESECASLKDLHIQNNYSYKNVYVYMRRLSYVCTQIHQTNNTNNIIAL